jgi:hypothetical protein
MDDILSRVNSEHDFFKKILEKIPGFKGYVEREDRRAADKLLRETIADQFESLWGRISELQREAIKNGDIEAVDDLESAALKIRQFVDRVRTASYGYAGFFDAVKVNTEELDEIYKYDSQMVALQGEVSSAIDNIEASAGTDGLPAAVRNLVALAQKCVDTFDQRKNVIVNMSSGNAE